MKTHNFLCVGCPRFTITVNHHTVHVRAFKIYLFSKNIFMRVYIEGNKKFGNNFKSPRADDGLGDKLVVDCSAGARPRLMPCQK